MEREELKAWSLSFGELDFVQGYRRALRAGLALQLVHFRSCGYFPEALQEIASERIQYAEEQLDAHVHLYDLQSDAARRHRLDILRHLGFRRAKERDRAKLHSVLVLESSRTGPAIEPPIDFGFRWASLNAIFEPSRKIMERSVRSALHALQAGFLTEVSGKVSKKTKVALEECLADPRCNHGFLRLKDDVGAATPDKVLEAADRLAFIEGLDLPFGV
ncbi:DUF4158 domain-containing protein, partial [Leisingera sp. MMG026]|uniref:DUF4158 domain-containing protein n=1 Tax=Leisingera sp. MMG026 TaxID=2909982 RepID=UPI001F43DF14